MIDLKRQREFENKLEAILMRGEDPIGVVDLKCKEILSLMGDFGFIRKMPEMVEFDKLCNAPVCIDCAKKKVIPEDVGDIGQFGPGTAMLKE